MTRSLGDRYVLTELIGSGGMGLVYAAEQPCLKRTVAVKLMRSEFSSDAYMLRRFHTEAIVGSQLRHPNLVAVTDYGNEGGTPYLVMELVRGESLSDLLATEGSLPPRRAAKFVADLLEGLAAAHAARFVHADVKTDNLIVEQRAGVEVAKLIDFGLARSIDDPNANLPMVSGTPEYLAPEVICGAPPSLASDVYGAGVVLYELLTGGTPFTGSSITEILHCHLDDDVIPPSLRNPDAGIPHALESVVMRALAKDPRARFADAQQFAAALAAATPLEDDLAVGTRLRPAFSSERPTRDLPRVERRLAGGSYPQQAQFPLRDAIARGDVPQIVAGYLELARTLVDARELDRAVTSLEEGVDLITGGVGPGAVDAPEPVWRLLLTLAALYDGLGDRGRARRAALDGQAQAIRCNSPVGRERARALIERLGQRVSAPERKACVPS
jgi:serine/threonine-protein kinase